MMRAGVISLVIAGLLAAQGPQAMLARADAPAVQHWGGSSAMLVPGDGAAVRLDFRLALRGFEVVVRVDHGAGDMPDRFTVVPPAGFIAVPAFVDVGEHDQGVILIFSVEGVGA
jgi:hypothetical protein